MNMMTKRKTFAFLSCVLALLMLCTSFVAFADEPAPVVWDGTVSTSFAGGSGTEADPYQIANGADLAYLAKLTNEAKEFYLLGDGSRVESQLQGTVITYQGLAKDGNFSYTYYLSPFGGKTYMTSTEDVETSYPIDSLQTASYRSVKINGTTYFTMAQPAAEASEQAYIYDAETMELVLADGIEIGHKRLKDSDNKTRSRFFIVKDYDEANKGSYPTSMGTVNGHAVSYTNAGGEEDQAVFLVLAGCFSVSDALLNSIVVEGINYAWLAEGKADPKQSVASVADENGNLKVTYGDTSVVTTAYASLYYVLTSDIALNNVAEYKTYSEVAPANSWAPIGSGPLTPFMGSFDGRGHEISGLYMKVPATVQYAGLFGYATGAEFKDLALTKGYIQSYLAQGALVGLVKDSNVSGIANEDVTLLAQKNREGSGFAYDTQAGGIVGIALAGTEITNCSASAAISAINGSNSSGNPLQGMVGGIVSRAIGTATDRVLVSGCTYTGDLYVSNNHSSHRAYGGGIVGQCSYTDVSGNVFAGTIEVVGSGYGFGGGIVGEAASNSAVTSNYASAHVSTEKSASNQKKSCTGGIIGSFTSKNSVVYNNVFAGTLVHQEGKGTVGAIVGGFDTRNLKITEIISHNNFFTDETGTLFAVAGAATDTECFRITADHIAGTATDVIATESTYANTASLVDALNAGVYGINRTASYTWHVGAEGLAPYKPYTALYNILVEGTANGACHIANTTPDMFPAGFATEGYALGETVVFTVTSGEGYVLRSVEYSIGSGEKQDLIPTPEGYRFEMPAADVTVYLNFVETGADVYKVHYIDCEDVAFWSSYQYDAHFKGYETKIPTPTRYGYYFRGWLVNDSDTPVMDLVLGGNDYTADITLTATWEAKSAVAIEFATQAVTYDAAAHAFVLKGAGAGLSGISVTYLVDGKWTTKAPTTAGTYKVHLVRAEDDTYAPLDKILDEGLVIEKAASSISIQNDISKTYENAVVVDPQVETVGDGTVSFVYYKDGTPLAGAPKDVGTYTVEAIISEGTNFKRAAVTATFTIAKATVDTDAFSWSYDTPFEYDTTEHTVRLVGVPSDIQIHYAGTTSATNAGEYTVSVTFTVDENNYYPISYEGLTWKIEKAVIDDRHLSWVYDGFVYDGTEKSVTVVGLPSDVQINTYTGNKATGAGTYTASVTFTFNSANYESVSITPLSWKIDKATYNVEDMAWTSADFVFDGQTKTVTLTGVPAALRVEYSGNSYVIAGDYVATAIFFGDAVNYNPVPSMTLSWTIEKADTVITAALENKVIYDGAAHLPTASLNHSETTLVYDREAMTEMGEYWYVITAPASTNYKAATVTVKLRITKNDSDLLAALNSSNDAARASANLREMFYHLHDAYRSLALIEDKTAADVVVAYCELNLTAAIYNDRIAGVEKDLESVYKVTFYVLYNQHPIKSVEALVEHFVLKDED